MILKKIVIHQMLFKMSTFGLPPIPLSYPKLIIKI